MEGNMRWRARRHSYRKPDEPIRTREYEVVELPDDTTPKRFVIEHHYSASFVAARFRFGLFHRDRLVGVSVFSHPCANKVLTNVFPGDARESVELGRFVLLDEVPGNAETWFLARCFDQLQGRVRGVLSFSDPTPRTTLEGRTIFVGHIGTIYQASNALYLGRSTPRSLRILPDGTIFSERSISKIRQGERGVDYSSALLERFGADALKPDEDAQAWLDRWRALLTRPMRHPGNHRYAWAFKKPERRRLTFIGQRYPKKAA